MWTETVYIPVVLSIVFSCGLGLPLWLHALLGPNVLGDQNAFTKLSHVFFIGPPIFGPRAAEGLRHSSLGSLF